MLLIVIIQQVILLIVCLFMSIILEPKLRSEPSERYPKQSSRHLKIDIFLNEKISKCVNFTPKISLNHSHVRLTPNLAIIAPAATFAKTHSLTRRSSSSFRQVLRHSACKSAMARSGRKQSFEEKSSPQKCMTHQGKRLVANTSNDLYAIRKQIEQRFERTKMILKEEVKIKKYQKIQQIYQNKFKSLVTQPKRELLHQD